MRSNVVKRRPQTAHSRRRRMASSGHASPGRAVLRSCTRDSAWLVDFNPAQHGQRNRGPERRMARIVVAMSGGVDSSVTAALLKSEGHEVIGVTLNVWPESAPDATTRSKACCGASAVDDARRVADALDIPYYVLNFRDLFREYVIADFVREYSRGRTPNPCVRCNQHVKFRPVLQRAVALGRSTSLLGTTSGATSTPPAGASACVRPWTPPRTSRTSSSPCSRTSWPAPSSPWASGTRRRRGTWPGASAWPWPVRRRAWRSASSRTTSTGATSPPRPPGGAARPHPG